MASFIRPAHHGADPWRSRPNYRQFRFQRSSDLANVLENPLEAPVKVVETRSVDLLWAKTPFAAVSRRHCRNRCVAVFMAIYYLLAGVIANIALLLNIVILLV